jgi:hypothetical protein
MQAATMDASYAITRVFAELGKRCIEAIIPANAERSAKEGTIPCAASSWTRRTASFGARQAHCCDYMVGQTATGSSTIGPASQTTAPVTYPASASA